MAQQEEPLYDFPEPTQASERKPLAHQRGGSLRSVSVLDRLLLTVPVWLQLSINPATALHILQREPPGTFLVRKSRTSKRNVLCVRLADDSVPSFVQQFGIREDHSALSLETSAISFPDLPRLISFYCVSRDVLPFPLELPEAIAKATSHKELESISHMGVEFWSSHLNVRGPRAAMKPRKKGEKEKKPDAATTSAPAPQTGSDSALQPDSDTDAAAKHPGLNPTLFHEFCPITTRSPRELDCGSGLGALCFINPLFPQSQTTLSRRRKFKHSVKVRVSTETSTMLSPPLAPPPPPPLMPKTKCKAKKGAQRTVPPSEEAQMEPAVKDTQTQPLTRTEDGPSVPRLSAPPQFQPELQEQDQVAGVKGGEAPALLPTVMENLPEDSNYMAPSPLIRSHSPLLSPYMSPSPSPMAPPLVPKVSSSLSPRDSPGGSPSLSPYQSPSLSPKAPRSLSPRDSPGISPSLSPCQSPAPSPRVPFSLSPFTSPSFSQLAEQACYASSDSDSEEEEEGTGTDENKDEETKEEETYQVLLMNAASVNDTESCSSFSNLEDPAETPTDKPLTNI